MTRPRYTLEHGSYYLRDRGSIVTMVDQVTLAFSHTMEPDGTDLWTLHKHGAFEDVQRWWKKNQEVARPLFGEINLVTFPRHFDPDRINDIIEHPPRLAELLDEMFKHALAQSNE